TRLLESGSQRYAEAALQIAVEAFDLTLGLGSVRLADAWREAELLGHCQQPVVPPMVAVTVCIALNDDGACVIEQHLLRHASEIDEGLSQASKPGVRALIGREPYPAGATVAKGGDKG